MASGLKGAIPLILGLPISPSIKIRGRSGCGVSNLRWEEDESQCRNSGKITNFRLYIPSVYQKKMVTNQWEVKRKL